MNNNLYKPKDYTISEIKDAVRERRVSKENASDITILGKKSQELKAEIEQAQEILDTMEFIHRDWLDKKIKQIIPYFKESNSRFSSLTESEILEEIRIPFLEGLQSAITQEKRLKNNLPITKDELEDVIASYFFDFYRSLRVSQRLNVSPALGLKIAKLSFRNNPDILINLSKKYKDKIPESLIFKTVQNNPLDPEAFLKGAVRKMEELRDVYPIQKYPEVTQSVIQRAVFWYSNPEGFIDKFIEDFRYIKSMHPHIADSFISATIIRNPKNAIEEIGKLEERINDLKNRFDLPSHIIEYAILNYSNPEEFLIKVIKVIGDLKREFPDITPSIIQLAAYSRPKDPRSFLGERAKRIIDLTNKYYPKIPKYVLEEAATFYTSDPEGFLIEFEATVDTLTSKYPNVPKSVIQIAACYYSNNPESYIIKFLEGEK